MPVNLYELVTPFLDVEYCTLLLIVVAWQQGFKYSLSCVCVPETYTNVNVLMVAFQASQSPRRNRASSQNAVPLGTSEQKQLLFKVLYSVSTVSTAAVSKSLVAGVVDIALSYLYIYQAAWLRVLGFSGSPFS